MIVPLTEVLDFLQIENQYFTVNASENILIFTYDTGAATSVTMTDGTFIGTQLASSMQTIINTALTCSSVVVWDSTTRKFTFTVPAGHTLTYTHAGSSLGLMVGFTQNHAASVAITSDDSVGNPTAIVSQIHSGVEAWVKSYCRKEFELATYFERHDGGEFGDKIFPYQYPITSVQRLVISKLDVVGVWNTNRYTTATVNVNSTGVRLVKDGTIVSTIDFATYTTIGAVCTAISAAGNGWWAQLQSSDYQNYLSTELRPVYSLNCINGNVSYIYIPYNEGSYIDFEVYTNRGYVWMLGGYPKGHRNIFVDYTAGYITADTTSALSAANPDAQTIPEDLKFAIKILIKQVYQSWWDSSFGTDSFTVGSITTSFEQNPIPRQARQILDRYQKRLC